MDLCSKEVFSYAARRNSGDHRTICGDPFDLESSLAQRTSNIAELSFRRREVAIELFRSKKMMIGRRADLMLLLDQLLQLRFMVAMERHGYLNRITSGAPAQVLSAVDISQR